MSVRAGMLLALGLLLHCAVGAGVFELQVLEFSNYRLQLASGACCGGGGGSAGGSTPLCAGPCRTRFSLCLKEYQSTPAAGACSFGRASSPVLGTDSFTLSEPLYTLSLPFSFRWTRSFTLILQAYDNYNHTNSEESGLIEEACWSGIVEPGAAWHALRHAGGGGGEVGAGAGAALAYRVRVLCQPNHYNTTCTTFCRPRDDNFGHYTCSALGEKRCLPGWQGDNCEKPVCKEGCHPTHGNCDRPGECNCRPGWQGQLCSQCQPYPGCKHGYCNGSSWDCTCDTNWGGILCDQDLNYCGTHEPCQHGGTCENTAPDQFQCTCADGFSGAECERVDNPCAPQPCVHGACAVSASGDTFTCTCAAGWAGALCDTDVDDCASAPCAHASRCRDLPNAFSCDCAPGWTGPTCTEDIDECAAEGESGLGPCRNAGACSNTPGAFTCACLAGWTGRECAANVDDCAGQCQHGATCIDLVDDFHCACAPGYEGRTCARDTDECASRPCRHGGECVDLLDQYRCICPVGFTGDDCEDDRDHCADAGCAHGASCYTAQNDYYCHCTPGWTGKNCTQRATNRVTGVGGGSGGVESCLVAGCGPGGVCVDERCQCRAGWSGPRCETDLDDCAKNPCHNNGTCVDMPADFACVCREGWTGKTCASSVEQSDTCGDVVCDNGGACVREGGARVCVCAAGWGGARCDVALGACACQHGGSCVAAGGAWACACREGWAGWDCSQRAPCTPFCPPPAACAPASGRSSRCVCPPPTAFAARRCLDMISELSAEDQLDEGDDWGMESGVTEPCGPGGVNGTWWWGCNVCWCSAGGVTCTRLWCGLPDCLAAPPAPPAPSAQSCRTDEVCVPAAPALCLRAPCAPLGECRRVAGRRVQPPALPAPAACSPTERAAPPPGCARVALQLVRERVQRGAHVERACVALRRAVAATLAALAARHATPPLVLLCDLAEDDDDTLNVALWVGEEDSVEEPSGGERAGGRTLAAAVRALGELVARQRLSAHPLLGAALRVRVEHDAPPSPAAPATSAPSAAAHTALLAAGGALPALGLLCAGGAWLALRRRRAAAAERSRHDEEKSNNLQNEENLRRYANPLPRSLYKAPNADARNTAPPRDKELNKRSLPPPDPPPAPRLPPLAPPERLTVVV